MNGIQSTTRFRKQSNYKRTIPSASPAPQRQRSGAKGGKALKTIPGRYYRSDEARGVKGRYRQRSTSRRQLQQQQQQQPETHRSLYQQQLGQGKVVYPQSLAVLPHVQAPGPKSLTPLSSSFPSATDSRALGMGGDFAPWGGMQCRNPLDDGMPWHRLPLNTTSTTNNGFLAFQDMWNDIQMAI